jgi:type I restriction enzyme S subunit
LKQKKTFLEQYKKGVMQKIFSQELRFKDDNGNDYPDWEEKKLGDCLDYIQPTKYLVSSTEYDNSYTTPVLTAGKTFILGYTNETNGIFENNLPVIIFDDFTTATQFVDFPFKAKSSAMKILIANEGVNIKFIYEAMEVMNYEIGGHERHWISKFAPLEISIPCLEEQTKIANFLSAIDEKINHCGVQIEKMEVWKKGLLQQMFV